MLAILFHRTAGRRPVIIVKHRATDRKHRLLAVVVAHYPSASAKIGFHAGKTLLVESKRHAKCFAGDFLGQIIGSRTESPAQAGVCEESKFSRA